MGRANTKTDIANLALASLGEQRIADIDDTSDKIAVRINTLLSEIIEDVQLAIQWQSLSVTITPTEVTDSYQGISGLYQYPLPGDFLDIIEVNKVFPEVTPSDYPINDVEWYLEDGYLITRASAASVRYKKYSDSLGDWSPRLKKCIWRKLAMELAMTITEDPNIEARAERKFLAEYHEAMTVEENRMQYQKNKRTRYSMLRARSRGRGLVD